MQQEHPKASPQDLCCSRGQGRTAIAATGSGQDSTTGRRFCAAHASQGVGGGPCVLQESQEGAPTAQKHVHVHAVQMQAPLGAESKTYPR